MTTFRKANELVKGDRFKLEGDKAGVYILEYDAYYPDPYGKNVALIYRDEGFKWTTSTRVDGQSLIELA